MNQLAKVSVFIARKNGQIDWLERLNSTLPPGEDCGYQAFFDTIDVLVMGRKTFETVLSFPSWPYGEKRVVVLSSQLNNLPSHLPKSVSVTAGSPSRIVEALSSEGAQHIYLDGGQTIHAFLAENLVNEMTITTVPILLGEGIPLFAVRQNDISLSHVSTRAYINGFVQGQYRIQK